MIGTPSNLELLLHCYYSGEQHPLIDAPAIRDGLDYLLQEKMIELGNTRFVYCTTEKGNVYLKYLMKVPFPKQYWIVPDEQARDNSQSSTADYDDRKSNATHL